MGGKLQGPEGRETAVRRKCFSQARRECQEPSVAKHRARWSLGGSSREAHRAVLTRPLEDSEPAAGAGIIKCIPPRSMVRFLS